MKKTIQKGYATSWEHIEDELSCLDLKIELLLKLKKEKEVTHSSLSQQWKGLVVSAEEVEELLHKPHSHQAEHKALLQLIREREARIQERCKQSEAEDVFLTLPYLAEVFQLSPFEQQVLIICLAIEVDRKYEKLYAYLQDDLTCKWPTLDLVFKLTGLRSPDVYWVRQFFGEGSKLTSYFLSLEGTSPQQTSLLTKQLKLDERMVQFILDIGPIDEAIRHFTTIVYPQDTPDPLLVGKDIQDKLRRFVRQQLAEAKQVERNIYFNLWGFDGAGKRLHAHHFAHYVQRPLMIVELKRLLEEEDYEPLLKHVLREAIIQRVVLCLQDFDQLLTEERSTNQKLNQLLATWSHFSGIIFVLTKTLWKPANRLGEAIYINIEIPVPPDFERKRLWEELGKTYSLDQEIDLGMVASKFRFTPGQIKRALRAAQDLTNWESEQADQPIRAEILHRACYLQVQHKLEKKATRIKPSYDWDDIILPSEQKNMLKNACNQIKYRHIVYGEWGFERKLSYGKGLSILFAGPPGTGKTMSAEVIAKELFLEIYKIDLSQVISKYIGETEKNLQEIFTEAQHSNAILFFDETDALFGKRSEVKDSHDKYANIEVAFLLQKMEEYQGISILATNLLQNIDEAFLRRISYVIKFPFPDVEQREKIWRSIFPKEAPLSSEVDFKFIAEKIQVAGGNIKNIAVSAAFLAAEKGGEIGMQEIIEAAKHELQKSGKILLKEDIGDYFSP